MAGVVDRIGRARRVFEAISTSSTASCPQREASTTLSSCATVVEGLREGDAGRRPLRRRAIPPAQRVHVLGRGQAVRRGTLDPVFGGSNPPAPTRNCPDRR